MKVLLFKAKLLIFTLCISLIPIATITTINYFNARNAIRKQTMEWLSAITASRKAHILEALEAKRSRTIDFSSDGFIRDSLEKINRIGFIKEYDVVINLNRHLSVNKKPIDQDIVAIAVVDLDGEVVASTNNTWIGKDMSNQEVFKQGLNKAYIEQPGYLSDLDAKCILISSPIISVMDDGLLGAIINVYDLAILSAITTQRIGMGETGEVYIVNKEKMMLTESRFREGAPLSQVVNTEPVRRVIERAEEMAGIYPDYRGVSIVGASAYIPEYGWTLLSEIDKAEAFVTLRTFGIVALILGFVSAAVVISVSVIFAVSISRSIRKLTHATEILAGGDLEYTVKVSRKDEIGILASSFDTMRIQLGKLMKSIEEGKKNWESTFDSVKDIIAIYGKDQRLIRCNKALLEGLNVKFEEIIGKKCFEIFHQIKKEDLSKCAVMEMTEIMKPVTNEIEVLCLGGIYSISSFPRFDNNGEFVGTIQIMKDITEKKQAEDSLKLNAIHQEEIIKVGQRALMGTDLSILFDETVAIVAQTLDVEFCKILELLPDGKAFLLRAGVGWKKGFVGQATVGAGSDSQAGYTLHSNEPVIVEDLRTETRFSAPPLLNDHGVISGMSVIIQGKERPFGVLGVHTSRRRTFSKDDANFIQAIANVLAESIERKQIEIQFRAIIENTADAIITINERGIIRLFNPEAERLFGYTAAEVTGQNIKMLMPEPYHSEHDGYLKRYLSTGKGHIIGIGPREVEALRRDGATFPMELAVAEMNLGEQRMFIGIVRDITRRKAMEKNIRESYKMASLGTLTAGVCHEVLNPLNIISSYAQLLLTDTKEGSETEQDLKKILEEVGRIVKITDNLLRFSRKEELETGEVEINSLLEKTISIVEPEIKLENIKLLTRFENGLPEIMANSDELRQVFFNLIKNAKDAMPEGGKLTISTQSIEKQGKPFVSIKFKDTGEGISEKNLNSIFDPFFTTKKEGKGTGLGLSIAHGIIENHGGKLSVNSKEGKGTTFIIDLPC